MHANYFFLNQKSNEIVDDGKNEIQRTKLFHATKKNDSSFI